MVWEPPSPPECLKVPVNSSDAAPPRSPCVFHICGEGGCVGGTSIWAVPSPPIVCWGGQQDPGVWAAPPPRYVARRTQVSGDVLGVRTRHLGHPPSGVCIKEPRSLEKCGEVESKWQQLCPGACMGEIVQCPRVGRGKVQKPGAQAAVLSVRCIYGGLRCPGSPSKFV